MRPSAINRVIFKNIRTKRYVSGINWNKRELVFSDNPDDAMGFTSTDSHELFSRTWDLQPSRYELVSHGGKKTKTKTQTQGATS